MIKQGSARILKHKTAFLNIQSIKVITSGLSSYVLCNKHVLDNNYIHWQLMIRISKTVIVYILLFVMKNEGSLTCSLLMRIVMKVGRSRAV